MLAGCRGSVVAPLQVLSQKQPRGNVTHTSVATLLVEAHPPSRAGYLDV